MSISLMETSTPRAGDEENRFTAHYSEADHMARFSSTGGRRYNNGSDRITLLAMYIMTLHNSCHGHRRLGLHHLGAVSWMSPSSGSPCLHSSRMDFPLISSCRGVATLAFRRGG